MISDTSLSEVVEELKEVGGLAPCGRAKLAKKHLGIGLNINHYCAPDRNYWR
jgi:hypothetical protein